MITGKPFTPLLGAVSMAPPVTMVSCPALPAMQPPTAALVFALVIASTSEHLAPVVIVAALAAPIAAATPAQAKLKARTTLILDIAALLPQDKRKRRRLSLRPRYRSAQIPLVEADHALM
jgi:hypothetical protein